MADAGLKELVSTLAQGGKNNYSQHRAAGKTSPETQLILAPCRFYLKISINVPRCRQSGARRSMVQSPAPLLALAPHDLHLNDEARNLSLHAQMF